MSSNNNTKKTKVSNKSIPQKKLLVYSDKQLLDYYDYLVDWTRQYVKKSGAVGLVLGISGGVDSSLASLIATEAFPENSIGVSINLNNFPNFQKNAREAVSASGIKYISLSLSDIYSSLWQKIDSVTNLQSNELAKSNIKPRMRMTVLYYIAQKYNYLVLGTDNADELYLGYFTKFGDGGVDLLPLGRLNKSQIRRLSYLKKLPKKLYDQVASADLVIDQTDEDDMRVKYDDVDLYLNGFESEVNMYSISRIRELHNSTEHKRNLPPLPKKKIKDM